jgi:membrane associated rhomboid family serine protease
MFPIGDDNSSRTTFPIVNYILIALNILVFVFLQQMGSDQRFTYAFSTVPQEILTGQDLATPDRMARDPGTGERYAVPGLQPTPVPVYATLLTSMFMHGSLMHLFGNMLYLWIFGDNIEHSLGRTNYLAYYLVCGILAGLAHVFATASFGGNPLIPSLGASGAISGVQGGYILLYPHNRIRVLMFRMITEVPAFVVIGLWFVLQLVSGAGTVGSQGGGVAYAAHIGGFIAGLALVGAFGGKREPQPAKRYYR